MAAETKRQIINRVLRRLREPVIADATTEFADDGSDNTEQLIAFELLEDAIEHARTHHQWAAWQEHITLTYTADADSVNFSSNETEHMQLVQDKECRVLAWDITDSSNPIRLYARTGTDIKLMQEEDTSARNNPSYIVLDTDGDTPAVRLFPVPSANRTIAFWIFNPPERAEPDTSDVLDQTVGIPGRVVRAWMLWQLSSERGEEIGQNVNELKDQFLDAFWGEVSNDLQRQARDLEAAGFKQTEQSWPDSLYPSSF